MIHFSEDEISDLFLNAFCDFLQFMTEHDQVIFQL